MQNRNDRDNDYRRDQRHGFDQERRGRFEEQRWQQGGPSGRGDYAGDMSSRYDYDRGGGSWGDERERRYDQEGRSQQWGRGREQDQYQYNEREGGGRGWEGGMGRGYEGDMGHQGIQGRGGYNLGPMGRGYEGGMGHQGTFGGGDQFGQERTFGQHPGVTQGARNQGPKGYKRSDERIQEDICDRLMQQDRIDVSDVEVKVSGGEVTLTGTVGNRQLKHLVENLADAVPGVKDVHNQIRVQRQDRDTDLSEGKGTLTGKTGMEGASTKTGQEGTTGTTSKSTQDKPLQETKNNDRTQSRSS